MQMYTNTHIHTKGTVINLRPDLFKCAVAGVPFVDIMVTMSDPSIPLTITEWEEWGNPNEKKYFDYMMSYSPVDNVKRQPPPSPPPTQLLRTHSHTPFRLLSCVVSWSLSLTRVRCLLVVKHTKLWR